METFDRSASTANPANQRAPRVTDQTRLSAATPVRQLEVPELPGYRIYWMADRPGRIAWAEKVGYEFVTEQEAQLNSRSIGSDSKLDGNSDLGSRVCVHGGADERGASQKLYLMKIKKEWYEKDRKVQEAASESIVATLLRGGIGADKDAAGDTSKRYVKVAKNMFSKARA